MLVEGGQAIPQIAHASLLNPCIYIFAVEQIMGGYLLEAEAKTLSKDQQLYVFYRVAGG